MLSDPEVLIQRKGLSSGEIVTEEIGSQHVLPEGFLVEQVFMVCQLLKESGVGPNGPGLAYRLEGLGRGHALLHHEVGGHYCGAARPAHHAVDHHQAVAHQALLDEVGGASEKPRNVGHGVVVDMEPKVGDPMKRVLGRVDRHVSLGRVEHVGHTDFFQVFHILDCFSVA